MQNHRSLYSRGVCSGETEDTFIADLAVGLSTVGAQNNKCYQLSLQKLMLVINVTGRN